MSIAKMVRQLPRVQSLSSQIDQFIRERERLPSNREGGWHVSEIAGTCPREYVIGKLILKRPGEGDPFPRIVRIWDYGKAVHSWYQERYFGPMGILWGRWKCSRCDSKVWGFMPKAPHKECRDRVELCRLLCGGDENRMKLRGGCLHCSVWGRWEYGEVPVRYERDGVVLVGACDGVLKPDDRWVVLEMKSSNSSKFGKIENADPHHEAQGQTYAHIINSGGVRGYSGKEIPRISEVLVMYLNKDSSEEKTFTSPVTRGGEIWASVPHLAEKAFKERVLPERLEGCYGKSSPKARKCKKRHACFGGKTWDELEEIGRKKNGC